MFENFQDNRRFLYLLCCILLFFFGCATTSKVKYTEHEFEEKIDMIRVGMSVTEFESLFGTPDTSYIMKFGKNTELEWDGLVYKYYGPTDTLYSYVKRPISNTFVFYTGANPPKLNHWNIEYTLRASKK